MNNLESKFTACWLSLLLILTMFIGGCQVIEPTSTPLMLPPAPNPAPTQPITAKEIPAVLPAQTAVPTDKLVPTPIPTSTPVSQISLSVPEQWREGAELALEYLNQEAGGADWQIVSEGMTADIELVNENGHISIGSEPIALAVPFTTDWEETTSENAQLILSEGHDLVTVMPWRELPPTLKALRIDGFYPTDDYYPLQEEWSLLVSPGFKQAAAELEAALQKTGKDSVVHLVAVGDIMLDRSLGFALQQGNIDYPFEDVYLPLQTADLTIGNLESSLGDIGVPAPKRYQFRAPPESAEALAAAGFDILSLANNHALDFGPEVLLQGIDLLQAQGIKTAGGGKNAKEARKPVFTESNGLKLAFLAYVDVPVEATTGFDTATWTATESSPGIAWADPRQIKADVQAVQQQSDLVIVLLHSGHEYVAAPSEPQILAAKTAVDAGADLVIGHHAHILQGIEYYKDGVIIYGTGNFAFEIDGDPQTALFHIWLDRKGVRQIEIQPAIIKFGGQPRLADEIESAAIRSQVYYLSNLLNAE